MSDIPQEAIDRALALVRKIDDCSRHYGDISTEAQAIVDMLPEPVDPDLIEARKVAAPWVDALAFYIDDGGYDSHDSVCAALAGIKRGRELATAADDRWIPWDNARGIPGARVIAKYRNGTVSLEREAMSLNWRSVGTSTYDIIAYRVVSS